MADLVSLDQYRPGTHPGPTRESLQATPFDGILEESRDLIGRRLDAALCAMLDQSGEALSGLISEARSREEREVAEKTREITLARRATLEKEFHARYLHEFRRRSDRARKIGQTFAEADFSAGALEIVGDDDLEETLKFNEMAAKLRAFCHEELLALDQRVGVLLGDASLQPNDNPFSPQTICDAYKHACRQLDAELGVRRLLLRLFDDHVLDEIRSVYKSVNAVLVQHSILPKIRYNVPRTEGRKPPVAGAPAEAQGAGDARSADMAAAGTQDFFALLQTLVASGVPGMAPQRSHGAANGAAVLEGAELMNSLTRLQHGEADPASAKLNPVAACGAAGTANVLHELKDSGVGAGMSQVDLMTLDIVALLFDQLFDDPDVPNGIKGLIGRMQIPMLKVAIADKTFFSKKTHPARRLLDTLGEIASRLPADFSASNALFASLDKILQELIDGFQDDIGIFNTTRERLQALVAEEDRRVEQENQAIAQRIAETENLALAKSEAQEEVQSRVQNRDLPGPVLEFVVQEWLKVLMLVYVRDGKGSEPWKEALCTMDELLWSVEPKGSIEERRKLATLVPGLIRKLAAGLSIAGAEDDVRAQFFAKMMNYHTQAISAPVQKKSRAAHGSNRSTAVRKPPEFSASITVKNPFGSGEVSVDSLDFGSASGAPSGSERDSDGRHLIAGLARGSWVRFGQTGDAAAGRTVRLILVSPRKTRYLFALDRVGKEIIQCSRAEIIRRFRLREAALVDQPAEDSLFDRVMNGVVGKLRARGAPH